MLLAFFPKELIYVWTGDLEIAGDVTPVLRILAVANFLFAMSKINMQVMYSTGWTSFHAYFSIIGLLLIIPLNYLMISNFGALGAAYSWLIFCIFAFIFEYLFLFRILSSLNVSHWILGIVQPLLASVTVIVCMKLVLRDFIFYNILTGIGALVSVVLLACLAAIFAADVLRESLVLKINAVINGNTFKS
jgi:O-antigen/teichoic acid export membrane protein